MSDWLDMMSEYESDESLKLAEMKFSPSYDISKVITASGKPFLEISSIYHYYHFSSGMERDNLALLEKSQKFSIIIKEKKNHERENNDGSNLLINPLPTLPCLLKLSNNNNKVVVFIPFSELIPIWQSS